MYKVYKNLHRDKYSIVDCATNLVVGHADSVTMMNVELKVNEGGRQRVIREQRKNVHAYAVGEIHSYVGFTPYKKRLVKIAASPQSHNKPDFHCAFRVSYNPYKRGSFMRDGKTEISNCSWLKLTSDNGVKGYD